MLIRLVWHDSLKKGSSIFISRVCVCACVWCVCVVHNIVLDWVENVLVISYDVYMIPCEMELRKTAQ